MIEFKQFPKIGQYRNALKDLKYIQEKTGQSIFNFKGTVKLHGTNAAIGYCRESSTLYCQSRNRIITPEDDNAGFAGWVEDNKNRLTDFMLDNFAGESAVVFGEWCGGNIQKGVALTELPKMFVAFNVYHQGAWSGSSALYTPENIEQVHFIDEFETYFATVDMSCPEKATAQLTEITQKVEAECPVSKEMGVLGTGEGVVWTCITDNNIRFKVKGDKHSVTKVKKLVSVDPERLKSIQDFVDYAVTENRLNQGLKQFGANISKTGEFIGWINKDIWSEEKDTLEASNLTMKDVGKHINQKARAYFLEHAA